MNVIETIEAEHAAKLPGAKMPAFQPGDTVIVRGVNHAWSNRSNEPCLLVGTMTDATPADEL